MCERPSFATVDALMARMAINASHNIVSFSLVEAISDRHGNAILDGDILRTVAEDVIERAGTTKSRIIQGNAARIQREMHATRLLEMKSVRRGTGVSADNQIDGVSIHGFAGGAAEVENVGRVQRHGVCGPVAHINSLDAARILVEVDE